MPKLPPKTKVSIEDLFPLFSYLTGTSDAAGQIHHDRTARISDKLAEVAGLHEDIRRRIHNAAMIHDVGKLAIHDAVLFKHGRFTAGERAMMETHPTVGTDMLRLLANAGVIVEESVITIVGQHHENYDGTGYPNRVKNSKIHVGARVLRIADFYEAITSQNRSYRSILPHADALHLMKGERRCFDPKLFDVFVSLDPHDLK